MSYIKAELVLPKEVLELVQKYTDGQCIYIPRKKENYKFWGENTQYREATKSRNQDIYNEYLSGVTTSTLAEKYFLSVKSIQRIVLDQKGIRK